MALTVTDLTTLNKTAVSNNFNLLSQQLQEAFPNVDLKRGVVCDLVLSLAAALTTADQVGVDLVRQSGSLLAINANPALADPDLVNRVISNFNVTRKTASTTTGTITIIIATKVPLTIASGAIFSANGLNFLSNNVYNARVTPETVTGPNDRLLVAVAGGWAFTIGAVSGGKGSTYLLKANTALTPANPPSGFVSAYATSSFVGGVDLESNTALISRLESGAAIKAWSNRSNNSALILNQAEFSNISAFSEVGYGDAEMLRYHSIFPVAFGGRTDMYVRTQDIPNVVALTKTATLVDKTGALGTWQFSIAANDAPGFYYVKNITQADGTGNYSVFTDTRSFNPSATPFVLDLATALEANYSRYSTASIRFKDTTTDATSLVVNTATRSYIVYVVVMPLIKDLQDYVNTRAVNISDVLIKAPVPCFMSVSFNLNQTSSDPTPNTAALKISIAKAVNKGGFPGIFSASIVSKVCHDAFVGTNMSISNIELQCLIHRPDGTTTLLTDSSILTIPSDPTNLVSSNTVAFILDPTAVAITIVHI